MPRNAAVDALMAHYPHEALTFDDVTLVTQYADFLPHETDLRTRLTRRIELNIPFLSAAMDTVTECRMAIAMAMNGGLGIIHKNLEPEEQARHVRAVKQHLNGLIARPVTFQDDVTLRHIQAERDRRGYTFSGFPILNAAGELVGIVTAADVKFARDLDTPVTQIMTRKVITAEPETTLAEAYDLMIEHRIGKLPLVAAGKLVGLYSFADVQALIRQEHPLYTRDEAYRLRVGAALGPADHARAEALAAAEVDVFVVDTAHGHSVGVLEMVRWLKAHYPERDVIAGNIATGEAALALEAAGADAVKVGIGPGSICTTRVVAGVGIPQLTAVYHCAAALEDRIPVISDGGIRHSGDVPKALVAGAETVMMGSILARTEESPGEKIISQGRQYVVYRGMGSLDAMKSRAGSRERYGQPDAAEDDLVPQGIEGLVPYAGTADKVLRQFGGGLRAALGYCGCRTLPDLRARGRLLRITHAGVIEGHAHDVTITKEAPNYRT